MIRLRSRSVITPMLLATACTHGKPTAMNQAFAAGGSDSTEVRAVRQLWGSYLESKQGRFAEAATIPSPLWSAAEQHRWPLYDLAASYIPDGAVVRVLGIRSTGVAHDYEIVSEFRASGPASEVAGSTVRTTVYATLENGHWVLANALPRKTAEWSRATVARIKYVVEPGIVFDRTKATRAAAFVDSLADALEVPRLDSLEYYVASSVDAALNALGVTYAARYGSHGGFAKPVNRQLFSGDPTLGENYRHELTHLVVLPLLQNSSTTILASEGFATWLGGTEGTDFRGSVSSLAQHLAAHPSETLDSVMDSPSTPQAARYSAGAVLCEMLFETGGTATVKQFLQTGPSDVRVVLERLLGRPWATIAEEWRRAVNRLASRRAPATALPRVRDRRTETPLVRGATAARADSRAS